MACCFTEHRYFSWGNHTGHAHASLSHSAFEKKDRPECFIPLLWHGATGTSHLLIAESSFLLPYVYFSSNLTEFHPCDIYGKMITEKFCCSLPTDKPGAIPPIRQEK